MRTARTHSERRHGLVLVQGGAGETGTDDDQEWQDFCHRIGWQAPAPGAEAEDGLEERIAERLFATPGSGDNVVRLDLVRAASAAVYSEEPADNDFAAVSGAYRIPALERLRSEERLPGAEGLSDSEGRSNFDGDSDFDRGSHFDDGSDFDRGSHFDDGSDFDRGSHFDRDSDSDSARLSASRRPPASDRLSAGRVRGRFAAAVAALAVAAVVAFVAGRWVLSGPGGPSASFPAVSGDGAPRATIVPCLDHAAPRAPMDAPDPSDVRPPRPAPRQEAKTVKPAPRPKTTPTAVPEPPGAVMARTTPEADAPSVDRVARRPEDSDSAEADPAKAGDAPPDSLVIEADPRVAMLDTTAGTDAPVAWGVVPRYRSGLPTSGLPTSGLPTSGLPTSDVTALSPAPIRASADVWSSGASRTAALDANGARYASASWSLSSTTDRWLGASVTPPPPPGVAQASVGAMVQLDLGKAFGKL